MKLSLFLPVLMGLALGAAFLASQFSTSPILIMAIGGVVVFMVAFVSMEAGLYILIFSMLLSPEFIVGGSSGAAQGQALERGVTLRAEDLLLVVIGLSWFAKNAVFKELGLFLKTPLNQPIFLYIIVCVISTGIGILVGNVNPKSGFFYVVKYSEYFIVFFMMVNQAENTEQIKRFVFCLLLTAFIVSIVGILQIPTGARVSAPFEGEAGEPNTFGGYLVFISAIAAGIFMKVQNIRVRQALVVLLLIMTPPFLFTQSRASYLALIVVIFVLISMSRKRVIYTGIFILSLIISPLFLPSAVQKRILYTFQQREQLGQIQVGNVRLDTSFSARLVSWQDAIQGWMKKPLFGYGVTGYRFMDAQIPRVLTETGIIGLTVFIYLLYSIYRLALTNLIQLKDPFNRGLTIGFLAGFAGLIFHSLGANTFIIVRIMEPFWFFAGIIVVLPELERKETKAAEMGSPAPPSRFGGMRYG